MVEEILGYRQAKDIFFSAMLTGMMTEKQASDIFGDMEKSAQNGGGKGAGLLGWAKLIGGMLTGGFDAAGSVAKEVPSALLNTALLGASVGGLGAMGYDTIKERLSDEDPETKHHAKLESMYAAKRTEENDSRWMAKVRAKRDNLLRNYKKMPTEEYAKAYKDLMEELDKKKAVS